MSAFYKTLAALMFTFVFSYGAALLCGVPDQEAKDSARFTGLVFGICFIVQRQSKK